MNLSFRMNELLTGHNAPRMQKIPYIMEYEVKNMWYMKRLIILDDVRRNEIPVFNRQNLEANCITI